MSWVIIDNYCTPALVRATNATWPARDWGHWHKYDNGKLATKSPHLIPLAAAALLQELACIPVDQKLGLTCDSFPDLEYLHGAGLHEQPYGTSLGQHVDAERHPLRPWKREASVILFLNECEEGSLDMLNASGDVLQRVDPEPNRLVIFSTPGQHHRVNRCLSDRRSVCLFFWSICDSGFCGRTHAGFIA